MPAPGPGRMNRGRILHGAVIVLLVAGCAPLNPPTLRPGEQPFDEVHVQTYGSAAPGSYTVSRVPSRIARQWFFLAHPRAPRPRAPYDKIHPTVRQWMATRPGTDIVRLMVTYADPVRMPRFPLPVRLGGRNIAERIFKTADSLANDIAHLRDLQYTADTASFAASFGAQVARSYWLLQATLVDMPLDKVDALSHRPSVAYIRPNEGEPPPTGHGDTNSLNDPKAAREWTGTESYYNLGPLIPWGWTALLDTGVRTTHRLFAGSASLCVADCVLGPCANGTDLMCPATMTTQGTPPGDLDPDGHGTSSAAILAAGNAFATSATDDPFRGVTQNELDCFQVYNANERVDVDAAQRAFELAVKRLNRVIVAEMQEHTPEFADIGLAAEQAYQAGAVVIGANGNSQAFVAGQPAEGRHAIGVGAYDLQNAIEGIVDPDMTGYAWGLTAGSRVKPDILGPTSTETAANRKVLGTGQPEEWLHYLDGTSGATPYVGGAASLLRSWMDLPALNEAASPVDPGQVYAQLLLSGERVGPFVVPTGITATPFAPATPYGVGRMRLPGSGTCQFAKAWVSASLQYREISIPVTGTGVTRLDAAIWWPAPSPEETNNLDLAIIAPDGTMVWSSSPHGVFEKAKVERPSGISGQWRLRIYPTSVGPEAQTFYWAVSLRPPAS